MSDSNGPRKEDEEKAYDTLSGNLQNMALIFLGFLLFISYMLFPYYFIAESYKNSKNILHFTNIVNQNVLDVKGILKNYSSKYQGYLENITDINNKVSKYIVNISGLDKLYNNITSHITTSKDDRKNKIENGDHLIKTYLECYIDNSHFGNWRDCNLDKFQSELKGVRKIILDNVTTRNIDNDIGKIQDSQNGIRSYNIKPVAINDKLKNLTENVILTWKDIKRNSSSSNGVGITYIMLDKFAYLPNATLDAVQLQNLIQNIENESLTYKNKVESIHFPVVGEVPLFNINTLLLFFPILIAIGFSFLSLQFKKIISIHRKLGLRGDKDKALLSWIDPLQQFPEKIYPLVMMTLPFILFMIFLAFISSIWYQNDPYTGDASLVTDDFLQIDQNTRNLIIGLNIFGIVVFIFSYYQIINGWREKITPP